MPRPYDNRTLLGVVRISYSEDGTPVGASFSPEAFRLPPTKLTELCKFVPTGTSQDLASNVERVLAEWLLKQDEIETEDRNIARIETKTTSLERWANGCVRSIEVEVYYARVES